MAEIIVCANRSAPPPGKESGWWRTGDPVLVRPDGFGWGREELNPAKFEILKLPGLPVQAVERFLEAGTRTQDGRRKFNIDVAAKRAINKETGGVDHQF